MKAQILTALTFSAVVSATPQAAGADAVTDWNEKAGNAAIAACISPAANPFHESRMYAMVHIAVHDALNAIQRRSRPYAYDGLAAPGASPEAAVAAAARGVLVAEIPGIPQDVFPFAFCGGPAIAGVEAEYAAALAAIPEGAARDAGIAAGEAAAAAIVALRQGDGSDTPFLAFDFVEGTEPGEYRFTPGTPFAAAPGWGEVNPFVLQDAAQFRPRPPFAVSCGQPSPDMHAGSCKKYAADLNDVKAYGARTGSARSADETQIATFWIESSPLAWNRLGRDLSGEAGLDLWENARLFGYLNIGLADGYIASLDTKYHYNFWRPVTAIHNGDTDGNPDTVGDPAWQPLVDTPPVPDYDSAHAVEGAVAAEVFRQYFGTDAWSFTTCSRSLPDPNEHCGGPAEVRRAYTTFSQAARENGRSRVLNGFHFQDAVNQGLKHGKKIGAAAVRGYFKPAGQ